MFSAQVKGLLNILEERGFYTLKTAHKVGRTWLNQHSRSCVCSEIGQNNKFCYGQDAYHIQLLGKSVVLRLPVADLWSFYMRRAHNHVLRIWISKHLNTRFGLSSHKVPLKLMACTSKGDRAVYMDRSQLFCEQSHFIVYHSPVTGLKKPPKKVQKGWEQGHVLPQPSVLLKAFSIKPGHFLSCFVIVY